MSVLFDWPCESCLRARLSEETRWEDLPQIIEEILVPLRAVKFKVDLVVDARLPAGSPSPERIAACLPLMHNAPVNLRAVIVVVNDDAWSIRLLESISRSTGMW
ncbi:MAG: hypothetical protein GYB64_12285, partial [Chloroflexi bacterium]|nr:hypothetical protein [Chloroflexota bacterium]